MRTLLIALFFISLSVYHVSAQKHPCPPNTTCPQLNNDFNRATVLTNTTLWSSANAAYSTIGATPDGQQGTCSAVNKNTWFKFRAVTTEIEIKLFTGGAKGNIEHPVLTLFNSSGTPLQCNYLAASSGVAFIQNISLTANDWYYFSVDNNPAGTSGNFSLSVTNTVGFDLKAKATLLSIGTYNSADAAYNNLTATPDDTPNSCSALSKNVWFKFQASGKDLEVKVKTGGAKGTMMRPVVGLYDAAGTAIKCYSLATTSGIAFIQMTNSLTIGTWYYISVDNDASGSPGTFTLSATNQIGFDLKEKAINIASATYASPDAAYTTVDATPDDVSGSCANVSQNVWFKFRSSTNEAEIKVKTGAAKGTLTYPVITLYNSAGTPVVCHALASATGTAFIQTTSLTPGEDYYFSVDRNNTGSAGTFTMLFANSIGFDLKEKAIAITESSWASPLAGFTNQESTPDASAGSCAPVTNNVWFKFQATKSEIEIKVFTGATKGSVTNPLLTLYNAQGDAIQCHKITGASGIAFIQNTTIAVGQWYYFSVDNHSGGAPGTFSITVTNNIGFDLKQKAVVLDANTVSSPDAGYSNAAATPDAESGICAPASQNVWFRFQALTTQTEVSVLTGGNKGSLTYPVVTLIDNNGVAKACNGLEAPEGTAHLSYGALVIGDWYYLSVDHAASGTEGTFTIDFSNGVDNIMTDLGFQYKYDKRNRMIAKKVPGADWVYMVYDERDRLVMTQDGEQRKANQWSYTKYDELNRPIITGLYTHGSKIDAGQMAALISSTDFSETYDGADPATHGYTNTVFPTANTDVFTVSYYDSYEFKDLINDTKYDYKHDEYADQYRDEANNSFRHVAGQLTGTKTRVLGESTFLWSVSYFDDRYRIVQDISGNIRGGVDRTTRVYDFAGKVLKTKEVYNVGLAAQKIIEKTFSYDHTGRLLGTSHSLDGASPVRLAFNEYNELGELVVKKLHSPQGESTFKQHVDYRYNIRGWLQRINNADLSTSDGGPNDFFGMEFGYNNDLGIGNFTPQYNGNISATKWSNACDGLSSLDEPTQKAYRFSYDGLNRLRQADFAKKQSAWIETSAFSEAINYDLNGNILSLFRNNESGAPMDWLVYNYGSGTKTNQLMSVTDEGIITRGFKDGNSVGDDYVYDANGNVIVDRNKKITAFKYNRYLNQSEEVVKENGEKMKIIYDGNGMKLSEQTYEKGALAPAKRMHYVGPLIYENDTLKLIVHDEGKIIVPKSESEATEYQYQIKDHLGNVRLTFTAQNKVDELQATMEDTGIADYSNPRVVEMAQFGNLFESEIKNVNQWLNHTSEAIGNAIYLDGSEGKTVGPYTILKVYPGDTLNMEVFAKFEKRPSYGTMPLATLLASLISPIQAAASAFDGGAGLTSSRIVDGLSLLLPAKGSNTDIPGAYLNYILFNKDFSVADMGFQRIDESAGFNTGEENTIGFGNLQLQRIIDRAGYIYVYVSNESPGTRVWMDDLTIKYSHSPIVQYEDYYPFGLSIATTAFERGNDKYQGMVNTAGTGLKDLGFRQYDAAIGRFHAVDPLSELEADQSTYQYAGNNPVSQIDVLGLEKDDHDKEKKKASNLHRRDRHKKEQRARESKGYSRYKAERRIERRQGGSNTTAKNTKGRSKSEGSAKNKKDRRNGEGRPNKNTDDHSQTQPNSDADPNIHMFAASPSLERSASNKSTSKNNSTQNNDAGRNSNPPFQNSVTPPNHDDEGDPSGTSVLMEFDEKGKKANNEEQYREDVYSQLPVNEARALYESFLVRNSSDQSTPGDQSDRLKDNINVTNNTTTADDALDQQTKSPPKSTPEEALAAIPTDLEQSPHFPNVSPEEFLTQLKERVSEGGHTKTNQGAETNFCWAASITKKVYEKDPKGMAEAMTGLYQNGTFVYDNNNGGMNVPMPSEEVRGAVGSEVFNDNQEKKKGRTINELDQMLFMTLADAEKYKGYTNLTDHHYDPNDEENPLWSGRVLSEAVKIWKDFGYDVDAMGVDAGAWSPAASKITLAKEALKNNDVVLFVNSGAFKDGSYVNFFATHYIHVSSIEEVSDDKIRVKYWDYGGNHVKDMDRDQFHRSVYGIIQIPKN